MKIKLITSFFLLSTFFSFAQMEISSRVFTAKDGMGAYGNCIADNQGYTWFLSVDRREAELAVYDGRTFTTFGKKTGHHLFDYWLGYWRSNRNPEALITDSAGFVWMGSSTGIFRMKNGQPEKMFSKQNGLPSDTVISIAFDKEGKLWAITMRGTVVIKNPEQKPEVKRLNKEFDIIPSTVFDTLKNMFNRYGFVCFVKQATDGRMYWGYGIGKSGNSKMFGCEKNPFSETVTVTNLADGFRTMDVVDNGFLFVTGDFIVYNVSFSGEITYLSRDIKFYLGNDKYGYYYFVTGEDFEKQEIVCDNTARLKDCGKNGLKKTGIPCALGSTLNIDAGDEVWLTNMSKTGENYVLLNGKGHPFRTFYPTVDMDLCYTYESKKGIFWASKRSYAINTQLSVSPFVSFISPPPVYVNGLTPIGYSFSDSSLIATIDGEGASVYKYKNMEWEKVNQSIGNKINTMWGDNVLVYIDTFGVRPRNIELDFLNGKSIKYEIDFSSYALDKNNNAYFVDKQKKLWFGQNGVLKEIIWAEKENIQRIQGCMQEGFYLLTDKNNIWQFNPAGQKFNLLKNLPEGKVTIFENMFEGFFLVKNKTAFFIENGNIVQMDSTVCDIINNPYYSNVDYNGRCYFFGKSEDEKISKVYYYEKGKFITLDLPEPMLPRNLFFSNVKGPTNEIILFDGTKILRYDQEKKKFYFMLDVGQNLGYIWNGLIIGKTLYVSGWGKRMLVIDLSKTKPLYPTLTLKNIQLDGKSITDSLLSSFNYGQKLLINYIGIADFNQNGIRYQTRVIGIDTVWEDAGRNEIKELFNLSPGDYRFEVRVQGESKLWSESKTFNFTILPPWYRTILAYVFYCFVFAFIIYFAVRLNSKRLRLANERLQEKIDLATSEIKSQKALVEQKQKEVIDSIHYAKRIQQSLLPTEKYIDKSLKRLKKK